MRKNDLQAARVDIVVDIPDRLQGYAGPFQRPDMGEIPVIGAEIAAHLHRGAVFERPSAVGRRAEQNTLVRQQIVDPAGPSSPVEIGRRGAHHIGVRRDSAGDEARIGHFAEADRDIEPLINEIDDAIAGIEMNPQAGMPCLEFMQKRRQLAPRKCKGRGHAQEPDGDLAPLRYLGFGLLYIVEDAGAALVEHHSLVGERELSCRAIDQSHTEPLFEPGQSP